MDLIFMINIIIERTNNNGPANEKYVGFIFEDNDGNIIESREDSDSDRDQKYVTQYNDVMMRLNVLFY